jgi:signal peptidase II
MKRAFSVALIVFAVIALDQFTKYLIVNALSLYDSIEVFSSLHIVNVRNTGAAFGSFKSLGSSFFIIVAVAAIGFVVHLLVKRTYNTFGLSLILGGAIGNLIDRVLYGQVVDFIDFSIGSYHWPAFNVADSSLTIGIAIILMSSIFRK